ILPGLASRNFVVLAATSLLTTSPPVINSAPDTFREPDYCRTFCTPVCHCGRHVWARHSKVVKGSRSDRTMKHNRIDARRDLSLGEVHLVASLGKDAGGLSASTIGRLKEAWSEEHTRWSKRDLSAKRYIYFWVDGIQFRPGSKMMRNACWSSSAPR